MKNDVLTILQMKKLHNLGVNTSQASMCYIYDSMYGVSELSFNSLSDDDEQDYEELEEDISDGYIPTFTLTDLLKRLPDKITINDKVYNFYMHKNDMKYKMGYKSDQENNSDIVSYEDEHPVEAAYNLYLYYLLLDKEES